MGQITSAVATTSKKNVVSDALRQDRRTTCRRWPTVVGLDLDIGVGVIKQRLMSSSECV